MNYVKLLKSALFPFKLLLLVFLTFLASILITTILLIFASILIYPFSLFMAPTQIKISFSVVGYSVLVYFIYRYYYGGE